MDAPPEQEGRPPLLRPQEERDKGLHTLLGPTSGQPSCFHDTASGQEKQVSPFDRERSRERFGRARDREQSRRTPDQAWETRTLTAGAVAVKRPRPPTPERASRRDDIETRHDATESFHAESGSGQKTATAHSVSDHEKSVTPDDDRPPRSRPLNRDGKRRESESDSDVHES